MRAILAPVARRGSARPPHGCVPRRRRGWPTSRRPARPGGRRAAPASVDEVGGRWLPQRVLVTRSAAETEHGRAVVARCEAAGVPDIELLRADRLPSLRGADERATYALATSTLAVMTSAPSARRLQPVPPSADWRLDLAIGCPAHCQYCYLAGSLAGPPVTRVFADLPELLGAMDEHVGRGRVTTGSAARGRGHDLRGLLLHRPPGHRAPHRLPRGDDRPRRHPRLGRGRGPAVHDEVRRRHPLLALPHAGRTRVRFSVDSTGPTGAERFEGGTARASAWARCAPSRSPATRSG
jgi:spore photoproduct lyase